MNRALRVFVMLSGGVDSSVAAARLVDSGYDVEGIYMRNWSFDRLSPKSADLFRRGCSTHQDEAYAQSVALHLHIPFRSVSFEQYYWDLVIEPFFYGTAKGYTPNPDVWCNQYVKYGVFLDWALAQGADYVASGHYARLRREIPNSKIQITNKFQTLNSKQTLNTMFKTLNLKLASSLESRTSSLELLRGIDPAKDQSYFLARVPKEKLARALFPIGHLTKSQVRAEAFARGLPTATKKDSQGICFVGKVPIKEFLKERFKDKKGDVVLKDKTVVGQHDGAWLYTIGERLGVDQITNNKSQITKWGTDKPPLYIVGKDVKRNILVIGEDDGSEPLYKKELTACDWNFFKTPQENEVYEIEIRYHQTPKSAGQILGVRNLKFEIRNTLKIKNFLPAKATCPPMPCYGRRGLALRAGKLKIALHDPVRAVTPGQTVVISKGDRIIGAGIITDDKRISN